MRLLTLIMFTVLETVGLGSLEALQRVVLMALALLACPMAIKTEICGVSLISASATQNLRATIDGALL